MKLLIAAALCAAASAGTTFNIGFVSSGNKESISNSDKVDIRLVNGQAQSEWDTVGRSFIQGVKKTETIYVKNLNALPAQVLLRSQNWNGLNFIEVGHTGHQVAQFKSSNFLPSGAPARNADGFYHYDPVFKSGGQHAAPIKYAQGRTYVVSWRTGNDVDIAGSTSPMYVSFIGSEGASRFYLLDDLFAPGHVGQVAVGVHEAIGKLQKIELLAGGPDSWNPVNFIEVKTPSTEIVQFEADIVMDQLVDEGCKGKVGIYSHCVSKTLTAVNEEGTAMAAGYKEYQATFHTGTTAQAHSDSDQFVQLIGTSGRSNFVKLGDKFANGQRTVVDLAITHDIGRLTRIKLRAGGVDGWNVVGDFSVRTPSKKFLVHFQTDLYMDEKPHDAAAEYAGYPVHNAVVLLAAHPEPPSPCTTRGQHNCCGNGICDATEDIGNCSVDCKHSGWASYAWGNQAKPEHVDTATVHGPIAWENAQNHKKGTDLANDASWKDRTAGVAATAAPTTTAAPRQGCRVEGRQDILPDGWTMAGTGNNYCNFCKCMNGAVTCTHKICGMPFGGQIAAGWSKCPKEALSCRHSAAGNRVLVTSGVQATRYRGGKHQCAYNVFKKQCTCYCKMDKVDYAAQEIGTYDFSDAGFYGKMCKSVPYKSGGFDPALGAVTVVASSSHSRADFVHDSPAVWVEESTLTQFTVCAREDRKHWHSFDHHDHRLQIEYYAFQLQRKDSSNKLVKDANKPFAGAQAGATKFTPENDSGGVHCQRIQFDRAFDREPIVVGSVDYQHHDLKNPGEDAITHWLEAVSPTQFRVCFRETWHTDDGFTDDFHFNWFAVENRNVEIAAHNQMAYSAAGMASSAGLWTAAKAGRPEQHACKWLKFGRSFATAPTVLVESKHNVAVHGGVVDWSNAPTHPATITYVNLVERDQFQVCASTLHDSSADVDNALQWNWIAFGGGLQDAFATSHTRQA